MARNLQFIELVQMYRQEAGHATNPSLGANEEPRIKARLRRMYRRFHSDYEWPHLNIERDELLQAGQRYYTQDPDLDYGDVRAVHVLENGYDHWREVKSGISFRARSWRDPEDREDPVRKWDVYEDDQYEVWPTPATNGHILRFTGRSKAKALNSNTDLVDLDADLIVMFSVAEDLMRAGDQSFQSYLAQAERHYARLKSNSVKNELHMNLRQGTHDRRPGGLGTHITVTGNEPDTYN
jgi:hypothetical protein